MTHNVFGPHDAKFYKLLGELEEEYYELKRKGYSGKPASPPFPSVALSNPYFPLPFGPRLNDPLSSSPLFLSPGEGFLSSGSRLGGSLNTVGIPQHIGKIKGLEAAEKRAAKQKSMGRGGVLGGGGVSRVGKSMREVLLEVRPRLHGWGWRCESEPWMLMACAVDVIGNRTSPERR